MRKLLLIILPIIAVHAAVINGPLIRYPCNPDGADSGIYSWWKADGGTVYSDAGTTPANNGDPVQQWNDSQATANNLAQGTLGLRPIYNTAQVNGKPAVRFDGSDDRMVRTFSADISQPRTFFMVLRMVSSKAPGTYFDGSANLKRSSFNQTDASGPNTNQFGNFSGGSASMTGFQPTNTWEFYTIIHNGTTSFAWRNSTLVYNAGTDLSGSSTSMSGIAVGSTYVPDQYGNFDVAELIIYTNSVSANQRQCVWQYLTNKYALPP